MVKVLLHRIVFAFLLFLAAWLCDLYVTGFFQPKRQSAAPREPRKNARKEPPKPPKQAKQIQRKATIVNVTFDDSGGSSPDNEAIRKKLLSASIHLVELHLDDSQAMEGVTESYAGVMGDFCQLNFTEQKQDPTSVPMFRHLIQKSPTCREMRYRVNIKDFAKFSRAYDDTSVREGKLSSTAKALPLGGAIFHESRCGSTLISNALQAMSPQQHRIYSEAQPEMAANLCGDKFQYCSKEQAAELLKDVIYIMSRTSDAKEERVFVKFHSDNSRNLEVFQHAFPNTPWLFVFRDPAHVIVSQFKEGKSIAKCVRGMKDPSQQVVDLLQAKGLVASTNMSREIFCAATIASYCEAALAAKKRSPILGTFVHYPDLPQILIADIFPNKFDLAPLTTEQTERVRSISTMYSKASHGRARLYRDDSSDKQRKVTPAIHQAVRSLLQESYHQLQQHGSLSMHENKQGMGYIMNRGTSGETDTSEL